MKLLTCITHQGKCKNLLRITPGTSKWTPQHALPNKPACSTANSPLDLNPSGRKLLAESGIGEVVVSNLKELIGTLESKNPKTAYDVQKCSFEILTDFVFGKENILKSVKDFAYNN